MSQGILLFAHNNERINYGAFAVWCAKRIHKHLGQSVSLVCDSATLDSIKNLDTSVFDHIIPSEVEAHQHKRYQGELHTFKNLDRVSAWDLTPYDETIILDTDVAVQSPILNTLWNSAHDIIVCADAEHVFKRSYEEFNWLSLYSIRFFWATQFYFRKTEQSRLFFETCKWVKQNYAWNSLLYDFDPRLVRNDYLWSIALHVLGGSAGSTWCATMPWSLLYTTDADTLFNLSDTDILIGSVEPTEICTVKNRDMHLMNKNQLEKFVYQELGITQ